MNRLYGNPHMQVEGLPAGEYFRALGELQRRSEFPWISCPWRTGAG
ncbi:MAG: hypothetical protein K6U03_00615 [Firmicutes bacterium]|nr:hypothetical protein [Bacillota bacterium]